MENGTAGLSAQAESVRRKALSTCGCSVWLSHGELGVCWVLLVGAMLLARTCLQLRALVLGVDAENVISVETRVPLHRTRMDGLTSFPLCLPGKDFCATQINIV